MKWYRKIVLIAAFLTGFFRPPGSGMLPAQPYPGSLSSLHRREQAVQFSAGQHPAAAFSHGKMPGISAKNRCVPLLDRSVPAIQADLLHAGTAGIPYTGEGVIVGIIDSGIDWSHPDFIRSDGTSRILYIWDQIHEGGPVPESFSYGSEYLNSDIQNEIDGLTEGFVQGKDLWGHGTHVTGIAAGNGRATGRNQPACTYVGVAPEADIIVVKGGDYLFDKEMILDGVDYIFARAAALGKPAVINISVGGTHYGPHDGTSDFEAGLDDRLWEPGRAVTVAAGNDGDSAIHFKEYLAPLGSVDIEFLAGPNSAGREDYVNWDIWYQAGDLIEVTLISPAGDTLGPVQRESIDNSHTQSGYLYIDNGYGGAGSSNGMLEMEIRIADSRNNGTLEDNLCPGTWTLRFANYSGHSSTGWFEGWLYDASPAAEITSGADYSTLLPEPANARFCITVASFITRIEWPSLFQDSPWGPGTGNEGAISSFSSRGPSRDGRQKPELAAPGEYILSSLSGFSEVRPSDYYTASDSVHRAWSGTSMAAPHVAGTIALILQKNPDLTSSEIKSILIASSLRDGFTGPETWTSLRGFGKLDASGAVSLTSTAVEEYPPLEHTPSASGLTGSYPNPFNTSTLIQFYLQTGADVQVTIYSVRGEFVATVADRRFTAGEHRIPWEGKDSKNNRVSSGLYLCVMRAGTETFCTKLLLLQ